MSLTKKLSTGKKLALIITISVIVIVILATFIFKFFSGGMGDNPFDEESLKAQGKIAVEATVVSNYAGDDNYNNYIVSYYIDDKPQMARLIGDQIGISVGDKFTAYYDPSNPSKIIRPISLGSSILCISFISIAIIIFLLPSVTIISSIIVIAKKANKQKREFINRGEYNNPYDYNNINNNSNNPTYYNPYNYNNDDINKF